MDSQDWHDVTRYADRQAQNAARDAARMGAAGGMRMFAASLRSQAELLLSQARTVEETADRIESGAEDPPLAPVRLAVVPVGPEPEVERDDEDEPPEEVPVPAMIEGTNGLLFQGGAPGEWEPLSEEMVRWLDDFDDRFRRSPHFVQAVNEAAENGLILNEDTAALVAARVRELTERARREQA